MHWTYAPFASDGDLQQGDILHPHPALSDLFRAYHPYFDKGQYLAFVITTQTCDLVSSEQNRRPSGYVSLAPIRALEAVLHRLLLPECGEVLPGVEKVYRKARKQQAVSLLERIFNQNEQKLGLFYLHPEEAIGIADPSVAFLRVSVAFKSEHYRVLTQARRGRLAAPFQSRLGWLVGNLYNRVATEDWGESERKQMVKSILDPSKDSEGASDAPIWVSPDQAKFLQSQESERQLDTVEDVRRLLAKSQAPTASGFEAAVERIIRLFTELRDPPQESLIEQFRAKLLSDPVLRSRFERSEAPV